MKKLLLTIILGIFLVSTVIAAGILSSPSVCCERTINGALCVNIPDESECAQGASASPTSCEATSYCKLGTCYDSSEGICMENVPANVCNAGGGSWVDGEVEEVPQCQLGCCLIGDQAAFVPLVRCKRLSSYYGVGVNYRKDISSEIQCIAEANAQDMGACVFEEEFARTCKFTTRGDCSAVEEIEVVNASEEGETVTISTEKKFYKDFLCSAKELATECARQMTTNCYQGKVYWFDSCGNRENVYSSDKDKSWNNGKMAEPWEICAANDGNSVDCGNCDYLLGARCGEAKGILGRPKFGNYVCKRTDCVDEDSQKRMNGESWCVYDEPSGSGLDPAGARYYRRVCIDGEVITEPCADFRNEICIEGGIDTEQGFYATAACRVNRWQDCILQTKESDCINTARRDCIWLPSIAGLFVGVASSGGETPATFRGGATGTAFTGGANPESQTIGDDVGSGVTGAAIFGGDDEKDENAPASAEENRPLGICVPNFPPGLNFWETGDGETICGQANMRVVVKYQKRGLGALLGWDKACGDCVENCEALEEDWAIQANQICIALGDCGGYVNYAGKYNDDGYEWKIEAPDGVDKKDWDKYDDWDGDRKFSPNAVNKVKAGKISAEVVRGLR